MALAITLHCLAALIWVGGMFFAYMILRPVASEQLEAPVRLTLWQGIFARFFPWVWAAIISLLATGVMMIKMMGGMSEVGVHVHIMVLLGLLMMLLFFHLFFSPYKRLCRAVEAQDWQLAGTALNQIRKFVLINLSLGLILVSLVMLGRHL